MSTAQTIPSADQSPAGRLAPVPPSHTDPLYVRAFKIAGVDLPTMMRLDLPPQWGDAPTASLTTLLHQLAVREPPLRRVITHLTSLTRPRSVQDRAELLPFIKATLAADAELRVGLEHELAFRRARKRLGEAAPPEVPLTGLPGSTERAEPVPRECHRCERPSARPYRCEVTDTGERARARASMTITALVGTGVIDLCDGCCYAISTYGLALGWAVNAPDGSRVTAAA